MAENTKMFADIRSFVKIQELAALPLDCDSGLPIGSSGDMWGGAVDCLTVGVDRAPDGPGIYDLGGAVAPFSSKGLPIGVP
mmetsp:Transcript_53655/g.86861  ORF Transcript_53655/g.86861 Transcript_53655/m.86861 type:complete len:81 (-) Transcript_53655:278-520(-)